MTALLLASLLAAAPHPLTVSPAADGAVTGIAAAGWAGLNLLAPVLAPQTCHWCDRGADGEETLDPLDRLGTQLIAEDRGLPSLASNVLVGTLPIAVGAADWGMAGQDRARFGEDLLMIGEVVALQGLLNSCLKYAFARQRPYAHLGLAEDGPSLDDNVSFYSGHTSTVFALVAAAATVATLRGYSGAGWVWGLGLPVASVVGLLRVAAGMHYATDVIAGALIGALVGVAVPVLLHPRVAQSDGGVPALGRRSAPVQFGLGFSF
jgi:membrane-associated phospholipid phosphatase